VDPLKVWGIFGRVNVSTTFGDIKDGTSNTIMTGELQRIGDPKVPLNTLGVTSIDGWAMGGPATMFTTAYYYSNPNPPSSLSNNQLFPSPGSEHSGGANYGLGDGSVRWISSSSDRDVFALLGSMADIVAVSPD